MLIWGIIGGLNGGLTCNGATKKARRLFLADEPSKLTVTLLAVFSRLASFLRRTVQRYVAAIKTFPLPHPPAP